MPSSSATISTASGVEPDLLVRLAQRGGPQVGVDARVELAARERDLALVRRHRLGPLGEDHAGLAVGFEQRDEHGGRRRCRSTSGTAAPTGGEQRRAGARTSSSVSRRSAGSRCGPRRRAARAGATAGGECAVVRRAGWHAPDAYRWLRDCPPANTTQPGDTRGLELRDLWESVADAIPDRVALVQGERRAHLARVRRPRGRALAAALARRGPEAGLARSRRTSTTATSTSRACTRRSRCAASPVNVNYRYLEDELVYLLDNSDAEVLLFHGEPRRPRRQGARSGAEREALDPGRRRRAAPGLRGRVRGADRRARADGAHRALRRRPLLPLHRRHHRHAQGRDVAQRGPVRACSADGVVPARRRGAARAARGRRARSRSRSPTPARHRVHLPASPLMHGTGAFTIVPGDVRRAAHRHARRPRTSTRTSCGRRVQRERVTQMAIVGDAFAKPMVRALEEAEARRRRRTTSRRCAHHQLGCDVVGRGEAGADGAGQLHLPRLARVERRRRLRGVDQRARRRADDREVHDRRAREGVHRRRREVVPGSGEIGMLAVGGHIPVGYYKDEREVGGDVPRRSTASAGRCPATSRRVEADGTIVLLGRGSVVHQLRRREDLPRRGRRGGEAAPRGRRLPRRRRARRALRRGGHRGRRRCAPDATVTADELAAALEALARYKRPRHFVFVARDRARPERQGRLQVGQGRLRPPASR